MDTSPQPRSFHIVPIPAHPNDRWSLTDAYVEEVWIEILGPTATLMARRLGRLTEQHPSGVTIECSAFADSLGVSPTVIYRAVGRLDRFGIINADPARDIIGVSGYAPAVAGGCLLRLSPAGALAHDRLTAEAHRRTTANRSRQSLPSTAGAKPAGAPHTLN